MTTKRRPYPKEMWVLHSNLFLIGTYSRDQYFALQMLFFDVKD